MNAKKGTFRPLLLCFVALLVCASSVVAAPGDNVALASQGGTASQSSFFNPAWPASNCINGITASNSNAQLCHSKRNSDSNEWWDVELPATVPINRIVIHNRTRCCSERILGLYVLVSDTPFPAGSDMASLNLARAQAKFEFLITADVTVTNIAVGDLPGRYVRIQKSGVGINVNSAYNLLEVQVFEGDEVDLNISKSVSDSTPNIGDTLTFTLSVENQGLSDATNFTVLDLIPAGFGSISTISHGGAINAAGQIEWSVGSLASGATLALTFQATVLPP